jgi:hypothetical protein
LVTAEWCGVVDVIVAGMQNACAEPLQSESDVHPAVTQRLFWHTLPLNPPVVPGSPDLLQSWSVVHESLHEPDTHFESTWPVCVAHSASVLQPPGTHVFVVASQE